MKDKNLLFLKFYNPNNFNFKSPILLIYQINQLKYAACCNILHEKMNTFYKNSCRNEENFDEYKIKVQQLFQIMNFIKNSNYELKNEGKN